jgi:hypothetical protein
MSARRAEPIREDHALLAIGICPWTESYWAAPLWLSDAVELLPLTGDQIAACLGTTGAQAATEAAILLQDADMQDAAHMPLLLPLLRQAFADASPAGPQGEHFGTLEERRGRVLERYADRPADPAVSLPLSSPARPASAKSASANPLAR